MRQWEVQLVHIGRLQCIILCMVTVGTAIVNSLNRVKRSLALEVVMCCLLVKYKVGSKTCNYIRVSLSLSHLRPCSIKLPRIFASTASRCHSCTEACIYSGAQHLSFRFEVRHQHRERCRLETDRFLHGNIMTVRDRFCLETLIVQCVTFALVCVGGPRERRVKEGSTQRSEITT